MDHGSSGATALLGMEGFVVLASIEEAGELFISVETTADVVGCGSCGVRAVGHGRSVVQVRDLPSGGRPVRLIWRKRRWLCRDPGRDHGLFPRLDHRNSPVVERGGELDSSVGQSVATTSSSSSSLTLIS